MDLPSSNNGSLEQNPDLRYSKIHLVREPILRISKRAWMGVWDTQASIPIAHPKSHDCGQPTAKCLHIFFSLALPENLLRWVLVSPFWRWWSPVADRTIRFWHWCSFHRNYVYSKLDLHVQVSNHSAISYQSQFPLCSQFCLYVIPMVTGKHGVQSAASDAGLAESNWWLHQFMFL